MPIGTGVNLIKGSTISGQANVSPANQLATAEYGTTVLAGTVTATGSGIALPSNPNVFSVLLRAVSGVSNILVGGTGTNIANSGVGISLYGGDSISIKVNNTNAISVWGASGSSGIQVGWMAVQ